MSKDKAVRIVMKPVRAWCVRAPSGKLLIGTLREFNWMAWDELFDILADVAPSWDSTKRRARAAGWNVVRVLVAEVVA